MRSKAPLVLIEQLVMLAVFALAATLCLRIFVWSDSHSSSNEARDRAVIAAQTAAETIKSCADGENTEAVFSTAAAMLGGEYADGVIKVGYDDEWKVSADAAYILTAAAEKSDTPGLEMTEIRVVSGASGEEMFSMETAVQGRLSGNE